MTKCLVLAGTHSGVGKTTLTVGLIAALRRRGLVVQPFKVGPDYIDPGHHTRAAGRPCRNLDTWMMPPERVRALFAHAAADADVALIEGVMGLYDGLGYEDETGSTAQVAKLLGAPVLLVLDAGKLARSGAALALGYQRFDPDVPLAGFILNRVGSEAHGAGVAAAVERATGLPILGSLPRLPALHWPERHLGLLPAAEAHADLAGAAADAAEQYLDLERILALAASSVTTGGSPVVLRAATGQPPVVTRRTTGEPPVVTREQALAEQPIIAVARDEAFHFTYPENLELLQAAGAQLAFFSPMTDPELPVDIAGVILSGGFPEVHAAQLAANVRLQRALRECHAQGMPIYAECGGLMYLTEALVDQDGREHPMVGLLSGRSVMSRRLTLGYRLARAARASWLLEAGETIRGHEFHYSRWEGRPGDLAPAYSLQSPRGGRDTEQAEGAVVGKLCASYVHLHFWGKPELAERFVAACQLWRRGKEVCRA